MSYLVMEAASEHDSYVAVVEWTPERAADVLRRVEMVKAAKAADDEVSELTFYEEVGVHERGDLDEQFDDDQATEYDGQQWTVMQQRPKLGRSVRTSVPRLYVSPTGEFWWELSMRDGPTVDTRLMDVRDDDLFPR